MQSKTFSVNGGVRNATITVSTETGRMRIKRMTAEVTLDIHAEDKDGERLLSFDDILARQHFAAAYAQSVVEGNLGFDWPESTSDKAGLLAACEAWLDLPGETVNDWLNAVHLVNMTPNDPDLKPPEAVDPKG